MEIEKLHEKTRSLEQMQIKLMRDLQDSIDATKDLLERISQRSVGFDAQLSQKGLHSIDPKAMD